MAKIYGRESAAKRNKGKVYKAGTGFINREKEEKETKPFSSSADIYEKQHIKQLENTVNKLNKSTVKDDKWQVKHANAVKTLETAKKRVEEKENNPYTLKVNKKIKAVENNASSIFDVSIKNTEKKVTEADEDALSAIFELDRQRKADMGAINSRIYGSDASAYNLEDINKQMETMHKNEQENMAKVESKNNTAMAASARLSDLRLDKKEYADKNKTKVYTESAKEDKNFANDANSGEKLFEAEKAKNITTDKGMLLTGLNEKEKRIYSYYLTKDKQLADDYLDSIADAVNTRAAKITYNAYKEKSAEVDKKIEDIDNEYVKFLAKNSKAAAEDIGEGTVSFMSGYQKAGQGFKDFGNMITGNGKTTNENAVQKVQQLIRQDQTGVEAVINDILYSTGNMLPAMLVSVATGGAGAPALATSIASAATTFASSSGNSYADAVKAGQDVSDAVTYGVISGASEALLQYGLSGINKLAGGKITGVLKSKINNVIGKLSKSKAAKTALTALADSFADAGGEALEEYLQTVLEPVFRDMVFGETNKREPFSEEALYSAMLGAFSSAAINTATGDSVRPISNAIKESRATTLAVGEGIKASGIPTIQNLVKLNAETGGRVSKNSLAGKIDAKLKNGEEISANEIGRLAKAVNKNLAKMEAEQFNTPLWDNLLGKDAMQAIKELSYESDFGAVSAALEGMAEENNAVLDNDTADSGIRYSIETNEKGQQYVKAERQVIQGDDPEQWANDVEEYINKEIRKGRDVQFTAADGDVLTVTADTAGKAKFRNEIKMPSGMKRTMTDAEYEAKLRAESQIDELAQVSKRGKHTVPDYKNHSFAKDGFNYRTAYFEDVDGQYYRIVMSVGKNGSINTIYNVGKMTTTKKTPSLVAQRPGGKLPQTEGISDLTIPKDKESVNNNIRKNEKNDTIKEKGENGNEILSYGSSERNDGKRTGGQIIRVDESARGIEERVEFIERIREEGRHEKRIEEDLEQKTEYSEIIAEDIPESLKNLKEQFDAYGLHVRFSLDEIEITDRDGKTHYAAGMYGDNEIILSMSRLDMTENAKHEFLHLLADKYKATYRSFRADMRAAMSAEEWEANLEKMRRAYDGISENTAELIEEMAANVYAGVIKVQNQADMQKAIAKFEEGVKGSKVSSNEKQGSRKKPAISGGYTAVREAFTTESLDKVAEQMGERFPLSEGFENTMLSDKTPVNKETVKQKGVVKKSNQSFYQAGKNAFTSTYGKDAIEISIDGIGKTELNADIVSESISKIANASRKNLVMDTVPYLRTMLENSTIMGIEKIIHTNSKTANKKSAIYMYKAYNAFKYGNSEYIICSDVVKNPIGNAAYMFRNIKIAPAASVTASGGFSSARTVSPRVSAHSGTNYINNISELYNAVKQIPRKKGGLNYTEQEASEYLFDYKYAQKNGKYTRKFSVSNPKNNPQQSKLDEYIDPKTGKMYPYNKRPAGTDANGKKLFVGGTVKNIDRGNYGKIKDYNEETGEYKVVFKNKKTKKRREVILTAEQIEKSSPIPQIPMPTDADAPGADTYALENYKVYDNDGHGRYETAELAPRARAIYARNINAFADEVFELLSTLPNVKKELKYEIKKYAERLLNGEDIPASDTYALFDKIYKNGYVIDKNNEAYYKSIRDYIKSTKIAISDDIRKSITDYKDYRNNTLGGLSIGKDGLDVDKFYQELNERFPGQFPEDIINPMDQLEHIARVLDITKRSNKVHISKVHGMNTKDYAFKDFKALCEKLKGDAHGIRRFMDYVNEETKDVGIITQEMEMEAFEDRRLAEAAEKEFLKNHALTDADIAIAQNWAKGDKRAITGENAKTITEYAKILESKENAEKIINGYKRQYHAQLMALAEMVTKNSDSWKDKKMGILYARESFYRNVLDVAEKNDPEGAHAMIDTYLEPIRKNEAAAQRFVKACKDTVEGLNLTLAERVLVQAYGEKLITRQELETIIKGEDDGKKNNQSIAVESKQEDNVNIKGNVKHLVIKNADGKVIYDKTFRGKNGSVDISKIEEGVSTFRGLYDMILKKANDELVRNGYEPIQGLKDYFPHFSTTDGIIETVLKKLVGAEMNMDNLAEEINGVTHEFKPWKKWFSAFEHRKGEATDFDAYEGFERYINGIKDVIYHTEDIQKMRTLEMTLRRKHTDEQTQKHLDDVYKDGDLSYDEKRAKTAEIMKHAGLGNLPNFVVQIGDYIDMISGKKAFGDRNLERSITRNMYTLMRSFEGRVASNMIGGNVGSWLTNVIPIVQAHGQISTDNLAAGLIATIRGMKNGDGFAEMSNFLTNRRGNKPITSTMTRKLGDAAMLPMEAIDRFVTEWIVRSEYRAQRRRGVSPEKAMAAADQKCANIVADRSYGMLPTLFHQKNPVTKIFTMFNVEVNNQLGNLFKDIPRQAREKYKGNKGKIAADIVRMLITYMVSAALFNDLYEKLTGRRPALDPIGMVKEGIETYDRTGEVGEVVLNVMGNTLEQVPFVGGVLGGGRISIASAIPFAGSLDEMMDEFMTLFDADVAKEKKLQMVTSELTKPLYYLASPTAGGQIKKVVEGSIALSQGAEYVYNDKGEKRAKFPVDNDGFTAAQTLAFGKYASKEAQEYIRNGFKGLSVKQTVTFDYLKDNEDLKPSEAFAMVQEISSIEGEVDGNGDKIEGSEKRNMMDEINALDISTDGKYKFYEDYIFSDETNATMTELQGPGISKQQIMDIYSKTYGIEGMKQKDDTSKTVANTKGLKLKDIIDGIVKGKEKRQAAYVAFGVGKKVANGEVAWEDVDVENAVEAEKEKPPKQSLEEKIAEVYDDGTSDAVQTSADTVIQAAASYDVGRIKKETKEFLAQRGVSEQDYAYVSDRISAYDNKVEYLQGEGFSGGQLYALVDKLVMGDAAHDKMTVAYENYGIPSDEYIRTYIVGYGTQGSKAERNEQLRSYCDSIPNLSQEQKDALYEFNKVSRGNTGTANKGSSKGGKSSKVDTSIFDVSSKKTYKPEVVKVSKYLKAFNTKSAKQNTVSIEDVVKAMLNNPYYTAEMKKNARKLAKR